MGLSQGAKGNYSQRTNRTFPIVNYLKKLFYILGFLVIILLAILSGTEIFRVLLNPSSCLGNQKSKKYKHFKNNLGFDTWEDDFTSHPT